MAVSYGARQPISFSKKFASWKKYGGRHWGAPNRFPVAFFGFRFQGFGFGIAARQPLPVSCRRIMMAVCVGIAVRQSRKRSPSGGPCAVPTAGRTSGCAGIAGFTCGAPGGTVRSPRPSRRRTGNTPIFATGFLSMSGSGKRPRGKRGPGTGRPPRDPPLMIFSNPDSHG